MEIHNKKTIIVLQENFRGNVYKYNINDIEDVSHAIVSLISSQIPFNVTYM